MPARLLELGGPFDPLLTLGPLVRGPYDPTFKLGAREAWRATRTDDGPATLHLEFLGAAVRAEAFGPGADRVLAALPELLGETDDRTGWLRRHPVVERLDRRFAGLRLPRTGAVFEALLPAILEQKIHGVDAQRSYGRLVRALGEPAPGPARLRLRVPPDPRRLAGLPYEAFHGFGVEGRRADVVRRAATVAHRLEALGRSGPEALARGLRSLGGIGPWTAAETVRLALGDPDAVSVGDYHLPRLVAWALVGEPVADDARMLELLEPWRGQRARVVRLIEAAGLGPPRRGPRMRLRAIEAI